MIARLGRWLWAVFHRYQPDPPPLPQSEVKLESRDREIMELERRARVAMPRFDEEVRMIRRGKT